MTNIHQDVPHIFKQHVGTWEGNYIKSDISGHFLSSFLGKFSINIEGRDYFQANEYQYPNGKTLRLNFSGHFENGILNLNSDNYGIFQAMAWDSGQNTIMFVVTKQQENSIIKFVETINLIDADHRVRSTQQFHDGNFSGINFIQETRLH